MMASVERSRSRSTISCAIREMARRTSSAPSSMVRPDSFPASQDRSLKGGAQGMVARRGLADADDRDLPLLAFVVHDERVVPWQRVAGHVHHQLAAPVERPR